MENSQDLSKAQADEAARIEENRASDENDVRLILDYIQRLKKSLIRRNARLEYLNTDYLRYMRQFGRKPILYQPGFNNYGHMRRRQQGYMSTHFIGQNSIQNLQTPAMSQNHFRNIHAVDPRQVNNTKAVQNCIEESKLDNSNHKQSIMSASSDMSSHMQRNRSIPFSNGSSLQQNLSETSPNNKSQLSIPLQHSLDTNSEMHLSDSRSRYFNAESQAYNDHKNYLSAHPPVQMSEYPINSILPNQIIQMDEYSRNGVPIDPNYPMSDYSQMGIPTHQAVQMSRYGSNGIPSCQPSQMHDFSMNINPAHQIMQMPLYQKYQTQQYPNHQNYFAPQLGMHMNREQFNQNGYRFEQNFNHNPMQNTHPHLTQVNCERTRSMSEQATGDYSQPTSHKRFKASEESLFVPEITQSVKLECDSATQNGSLQTQSNYPSKVLLDSTQSDINVQNLEKKFAQDVTLGEDSEPNSIKHSDLFRSCKEGGNEAEGDNCYETPQFQQREYKLNKLYEDAYSEMSIGDNIITQVSNDQNNDKNCTQNNFAQEIRSKQKDSCQDYSTMTKQEIKSNSQNSLNSGFKQNKLKSEIDEDKDVKSVEGDFSRLNIKEEVQQNKSQDQDQGLVDAGNSHFCIHKYDEFYTGSSEHMNNDVQIKEVKTIPQGKSSKQKHNINTIKSMVLKN